MKLLAMRLLAALDKRTVYQDCGFSKQTLRALLKAELVSCSQEWRPCRHAFVLGLTHSPPAPELHLVLVPHRNIRLLAVRFPLALRRSRVRDPRLRAITQSMNMFEGPWLFLDPTNL